MTPNCSLNTSGWFLVSSLLRFLQQCWVSAWAEKFCMSLSAANGNVFPLSLIITEAYILYIYIFSNMQLCHKWVWCWLWKCWSPWRSRSVGYKPLQLQEGRIPGATCPTSSNHDVMYLGANSAAFVQVELKAPWSMRISCKIPLSLVKNNGNSLLLNNILQQ